MTMRKFWRNLRRFRNKESAFVGVSILVLGALVTYGIMQSRTVIDPAAYTPLLTTIAEGESHGNYNAYFSNASNREIQFTTMSLADVLAWQKGFVEAGNASNAAGKYQIIQPALEKLITQLGLSEDTVFDETLQDRLAITLAERRGSIEFVGGKISAEQFAHNLSQEWAALPQITGENPEKSFYDGDGLNAAQVDSQTILTSIEDFKQKARSKQ